MKSREGSPYGTKVPRLAPKGSLVFVRACSLAKISNTRRQWSKWKRQTGAAYGFVNQAKAELAAEANGGTQ